MDKLKVAVVGFGFMGVTHTMNILKNKDLEDIPNILFILLNKMFLILNAFGNSILHNRK